MKYIIIMLLLAGACSTVPSDISMLAAKNNYNASIEEKSKLYPYFDIKLDSFCVQDADYRGDADATAEQQLQARTFTVEEKRYILQTMDLVRFTLNSPEFYDRLTNLSHTLNLTRTGSGELGSNYYGQAADLDRIMDMIKIGHYGLIVRKMADSSGAIARGDLGPFIYHDPIKIYNPDRRTRIHFPNHVKQTSRHQVNLGSTILHESMHNFGFTHDNTVPNSIPYGVQPVFEAVARQIYNGELRAQEYEAFKGYHEEKYSEWLLADTLALTARIASPNAQYDSHEYFEAMGMIE